METYIETVATKSGISPTVITAILAFVAQMISVCQPAPTPAPTPTPTPAPKFAAPQLTDTRRNRLALYRAMFANGVRPLSHEGQTLATELFAAAATATPEAVDEFMAMAQ